MSSFKKNERVVFQYKDETIYGVVRKGGAKACEVIADGGTKQYKVPPALLKKSDKPLPRDPEHPMDAWGIEKYSTSAAASEETTFFTAVVTRNGKPVIHAQNSGRGGCNLYRSINGQYSDIAQFEADAKQWMIDHGMPEAQCFETADFWLSWKAEMAPYGVTAADHIKNWQKEISGAYESEETPGMKF